MIRKTWHRAALALVMGLTAALVASGGSANAAPSSGSAGESTPPDNSVPAYTTKGPIEAKYQAQGPWAVAKADSGTSCDREQHLCDVWYPAALGTNPLTGAQSGFQHPVLVWANGSGQAPTVYQYYLQHLASWGFIVVTSRDDQTGDGGTTIDAANYLITQAQTPSSVFYGKVDLAEFAAAGHSQGGSSITNLHVHNNPIFKTYVGIHTAPPFFAKFCCGVEPSSYTGATVSGSMFQWSSVNDSGTTDWYDAVPANVQKAFALLQYTNHGDVAGLPECPDSGCAQGAYGYLGYSTAWLMWQLQGARDGQAAFAPGGEYYLPNPNWARNLSNVQ
ncbi:hypothetical protein ACWEVD_01725 [Nocardia thailandica]